MFQDKISKVGQGKTLQSLSGTSQVQQQKRGTCEDFQQDGRAGLLPRKHMAFVLPFYSLKVIQAREPNVLL